MNRLIKLIFLLFISGTYPALIFSQSSFTNNRLRMASDFERRGDYERALDIYLGLYQMVPSNQLYYEGVKRNMLNLRRYDELIGIIKTRLSQRNDLKLWADLGDVYYKAGKEEEAKQLWNELLQKYASDRRIYPYVANAMLQNRLYDEAIAVYKLARKNLKQKTLFIFELANIYTLRLNFKEATLEYLKYLEKYPKQFTYIESRIYKYTDDPEDAREVAEVLLTYLPKSRHKYLMRKLLANLYIRMKDFSSALREFKKLENVENPLEGQQRIPGREIFTFADQAFKAGQYKFAREAYSLLLEKYPNSPFQIQAKLGLALTNQKQGFFEQAITNYDEIIRMVPNSVWAQEAMFKKGEIYFKDQFDLSKAIETFKDLLKRYPKGSKTIECYFRLGDCYAAQGKFKKAQKWYERPLLLIKTNSAIKEKAQFKSAWMDFIMGNFEAALEKLHKITAEMNAATAENYENDALELIFLIEENLKENQAALKLYAQANGFSLQRNYSEAILKLRKILENFPTIGLIDETLIKLGELEDKRKNYTGAITYLEGLLKEYPESIYNDLAQKRIAEIYENGLHDLQKAKMAYEAFLMNFPNSVYIEEVRQKLRNLESKQLNN